MNHQLSGYPKIYSLGHAAVKELLLDPVVVEEKVDGSQFSFGLMKASSSEVMGTTMEGYDLCFRSKEAVIEPDAPPKMFARGVEAVKTIAHLLTPGWIYRGEYLEKPKHNTLAYNRIPSNHIILFDITTGPECYLAPAVKFQEAERLGFEMVPTLHEGMLNAYDSFADLLKRDSILGGQKVEGVVIKNYSRFGRDGKALMGKFVSEAYKEIHKGDWKDRNPSNNDVIQLLVQELRSPARWEKAIQHLRDRNELQNAPQDIGPLFKEVQADILAECAADIKERLFKHAWKMIGRGIVAGLPEWYKERLAKQQFEAVPTTEETRG